MDYHGMLVEEFGPLDITNLVFLSAFCLSVFVRLCRNRTVFGIDRKEWPSLLVSLCFVLTGAAYFGVALFNLIATTGETSKIDIWLILVARGVIWILLASSLIVQQSNWIIILSLVWWVCFFLLVSGVSLQKTLTTHEVHIMIEWPLGFFLFICAVVKARQMFRQRSSDEDSLSEPLLDFKTEKQRPNNPGQASFLSSLTFSWMDSLLRVGYSKPLTLDDIPDLSPEDEASLAYQKLIKKWESLTRGSNNASNRNLVLEAIAKVFFRETVLVGVCALLKTITCVCSPVLLFAFVNYSKRGNGSAKEGLVLVGILVVVKLVESLSQRHWFFNSRRSGMRMRSALMVAVYQKQLRLSSSGRSRHSTGEVVNYIAVDAYRMGEFPWWFHSLWSFTLQLLLSIGVLLGIVGIGALPGLIPLLVCALLNIPFAKFLQICQAKLMVAQDERLRATSEILNNMKIIKLQSWEEKFRNLVQGLRDAEFKWLSKSAYSRAYGTALYWMSPTLVSSVVFLGCSLFKSAPLDSGTIFSILVALRGMSEPVRMIPEALSVMIQAKVSFDRINAFLLDDELSSDGINKLATHKSDSSLMIKSGAFKWDQDSSISTLREINLDVQCGQKIAICGPVGAGKSSLLCALLGEIPKSSGTVNVCGSVAYVVQTAWIQSGTVRDNILFGKPMEASRYESSIKACALDKDISSFSHGDLTEIGQRGINMSGGQKQRIQLARAVYNDADIYLLDDPFSAVDAHTAATLFNDCVMTELAAKTVILVTHQVEFLSEVDKILVMEGGRVTQSGSYEDLLKVGTPFEQLVNAHKDAISSMSSENGDDHLEMVQQEILINQKSESEISAKDIAGAQLTEEEEMTAGDVGWKPFYDYIRISDGSCLLWLSVAAQTGFVALQAAATYWLAIAIRFSSVSDGALIAVYTGISVASTVFVFLRSVCAARLGLSASKAFFSNFTSSIFKAPMLFFDSTPVGRIFTRASSDQSVLDFDIPFAVIFVMGSGMELLATIGIMASVTWPVLIVATFAVVASKYVQGYYMASARELIRINGTTKAPIMNYAAETSQGVVTIRAFNMTGRFFRNYLSLVDTDARLFFYSNASMEWLILRVEALQNLTLFTAALLMVLLPKGYVPPGLVGLSLSYALALTGTQVFMTRWYCNLSNYIISVERIKQFMHIPPEAPAIIDSNRPPASWPHTGRIELQNLKIKYRPNAPLVLKGISCIFEEGKRVGVVGRTGSGKTTLISALFRLVEPTSGKILIDEIDICSIGLKDLRMKLSIIPQEPALFKGSVRSNMDPLGLHSDDEIWRALEKCQLKETISGLPDLLDSSVSDEGQNWSVGQRQLFCLGRVLLKRNKILVLDEATASIDSNTDSILQKVIRQEFVNCTVITVAHRVPTVIDSDKVMVLSYGKLMEYDEPSNLMNRNSYFAKLVAEYWASCRRNSSEKL
uniref:ABC-type xenobiotic transporter n=1 Tax=Kalanchoe fedtschenkoi TaxID=63787 RepID=A0A7N0TJ04_KALFE